MSSSDDQIIQSVDGIISAVEKLVGEIRVAPDIELDAKNFALSKVSAVAKDLDLINRALFLNDYPDTPIDTGISADADKNGNATRTAIIAETGNTINDMLSSWSQTETESVDQNLGKTAGAKKPRIVVSPVTRTVTDKEETVASTAGEGEEKQDFSVATSFEESLISSLVHSETSLVSEREEEETLSHVNDDEVTDSLEDVISTQVQLTEDEVPVTQVFEADKTDEVAAELPKDELQVDVLQGSDVSSEPKVSDDLTLIQGIDGNVSELLSQHGIHTFLDIAEFREADMLRLSDELSDPCRVSRENWIEQAALLTQNVSTYYAQKNNNDVLFDRLSLNEHYLIHPEVIEEQIDDAGDFDSNEEDEAVHSADLYVPPKEEEVSLSAVTEDPPVEVQEFTDALLAKKQALEAELAALTDQMVKKSEIEQNGAAEVSFLDPDPQPVFDDVEVEGEAAMSPLVEVLTYEEGQNELSELSAFIDDEEDANYESNEDLREEQVDELGDGAIWHEEVSTGKDYVPPIIDEFETSSDAEYYVTPETSFTQSPEENVHNETFYTETSYQEPSYEETSPDHEEAYSYSVDELSEHAPTSHLDEMSDFHRQSDFPLQNGEADGGNQDGYLSIPLSEPLQQDFLQHETSQQEQISMPEFRAELQAGQSPEVPLSSQAEYMDDISVPRDSLRPEGPQFRADEGQTEPLEGIDPSFMERSIAPSDLHSDSIQNDETTEDGSPAQDSLIVGLQVGETVSDKVPEIKAKIGNDRTLGQYLASKSQSEMDETLNSKAQLQTPIVERSHTSSPLPPQSEEFNELSIQDRSISLPPAPPVAPQMDMSDVRRPVHPPRPPVPPSNISHPPAPPVASGINVPPALSREGQGRGQSEIERSGILSESQVAGRANVPPLGDGTELRAMPPLPPQDFSPQSPPPHDPSQGLSPQKGLPPQTMPSHVDGGLPPAAPDMFAPMDEGQAYADTQRIIAAKRRADAERARNRSDIPNGQAYSDTQQLMENGIPFEHQQKSGYLSGPDGVPPLPPEAAKAASAYPRGANNPDLHYRGHKPQKFAEGGLPPLEESDDRNDNQKSGAPTGFKAKAKQLAESLQRSFVDKD
ncbi:hypothetical protein NBRC116602_09220 [Hyphomicrobiales bacterium 4NK60-0047b]